MEIADAISRVVTKNEKWQAGHITLSLKSDKYFQAAIFVPLLDKQRTALIDLGWEEYYSNDLEEYQRFWIATDEPDELSSIADDLIEANLALGFAVLGLTQTSKSEHKTIKSKDEQSHAIGLLPIFVGEPNQLYIDLFCPT
jgi:hypothetical protein